jgi:hypothetical protein
MKLSELNEYIQTIAALGAIIALVAVGPKYAQRYLADFQYRINRRFDLKAMIPRLAFAALRSPPMAYKLLKIGLA